MSTESQSLSDIEIGNIMLLQIADNDPDVFEVEISREEEGYETVDFGALVEAMQGNDHVSFLLIHDSILDDHNGPRLGELFSSNQSVTHFTIDSYTTPSRVLTSFINSLTINTTLECVYLSCCDVGGDDFVASLQNCLPRMRGLKDLTFCQVWGMDIVLLSGIFRGLRSNTSIESLTLGRV